MRMIPRELTWKAMRRKSPFYDSGLRRTKRTAGSARLARASTRCFDAPSSFLLKKSPQGVTHEDDSSRVDMAGDEEEEESFYDSVEELDYREVSENAGASAIGVYLLWFILLESFLNAPPDVIAKLEDMLVNNKGDGESKY